MLHIPTRDGASAFSGATDLLIWGLALLWTVQFSFISTYADKLHTCPQPRGIEQATQTRDELRVASF